MSKVVDRVCSGGFLSLGLILPLYLHTVLELHAGTDERQEARAIELSPTLLRPVEQLVREDYPPRS